MFFAVPWKLPENANQRIMLLDKTWFFISKNGSRVPFCMTNKGMNVAASQIVRRAPRVTGPLAWRAFPTSTRSNFATEADTGSYFRLTRFWRQASRRGKELKRWCTLSENSTDGAMTRVSALRHNSPPVNANPPRYTCSQNCRNILPAVLSCCILVYMYRVAEKTGTLCFVCLNFVKYWPTSKLFTLWIRRTFAIILSLKIPPHLKCVATLPCEMSMS